ncbi:MAG TPA: hypothetical protein PLM73_06035 [Petrotogaceae bacterium]|jgi:hypothetical protein|nr:hypothetical protein [Petrotogaceae bacterium]HQF33252.1 hypothetical protein [Petrotogaceae bacterium]HQH33538.1 hypothetical protein [Petrotogaceae bacterium]
MIADIFNVSTDYLLERTIPENIMLNALTGQNVPDTVLQKLLKLDRIETENFPIGWKR